ncbi:expressed unknown protein [Seminavis robusta]|uniref:DUF4336 domain-containing protein n=1 Tax=Seminavis robusta TaxID=568900 RepID=A0A9N8DKL1_9STRA|nr:expressed unknown protein [Seminavis robusta]|eukprot:Sro194_g082790.1 n/a (468) ;mRNA; r:35632-37151
MACSRWVSIVAFPLLGFIVLGKADAFHLLQFPPNNRAVGSSSATTRNKCNIKRTTGSSRDLYKSCNDTEASTGRRSYLGKAAAMAAATLFTNAPVAHGEITEDSQWPLWPALPVAPYSRRRTIRQEVVPGAVWTFDQVIGIYYVFVPIRMTVTASKGLKGLVVYAPAAPTKECLNLLQELIDVHGPVKAIILPTVAVEHKVNAGPFARQFPNALFYVTDRQYSFPISLPGQFLGFPSWTQPLPVSSEEGNNNPLGPDFSWEVISVKPGPASQYQDVALLHKPSKSLMICDALFATTAEPPSILTQEPEYTRALLFHAREEKDEIVPDTPENRRKGWRRIVLLFNFFFPGSGVADLGDNGKPTIYTIVQIILSRDPAAVTTWVNKVGQWDFVRVIPAHLDAPLAVGPSQFRDTYDFLQRDPSGGNEVRYCDEDVAFLRKAEEGFLSFSVYPSKFGALRGRNGDCGLVN